MDREWIDRWMETLSRTPLPERMDHFEPSKSFYSLLESGEDGDLLAATNLLGNYLDLSKVPSVTYEWGLRIQPDAAGQIRGAGGERSLIQIPLFYVGRPEPLGAILAHELTHEVLALARVAGRDLDESERLTDLASIFIGLGKLVLNGTITGIMPANGDRQVLGYLGPELKAYAYCRLNRDRKISDEAARRNLTDQAVHLLSSAPNDFRD